MLSPSILTNVPFYGRLHDLGCATGHHPFLMWRPVTNPVLVHLDLFWYWQGTTAYENEVCLWPKRFCGSDDLHMLHSVRGSTVFIHNSFWRSSSLFRHVVYSVFAIGHVEHAVLEAEVQIWVATLAIHPSCCLHPYKY